MNRGHGTVEGGMIVDDERPTPIPGDRSPDLSTYSRQELLVLYVQVMNELRKRGIVRSFNNPVGDIGEGIVCEALNLTMANKSSKGYDATGQDGMKYQIKTRWRGARGWRNIVGLRDLEAKLFDRMAVVILAGHDYKAEWLFHFPYEVALEFARPTTRGFKRIRLNQEFLRDQRVTWVMGSPPPGPAGPLIQEKEERPAKDGRDAGATGERVPLHVVMKRVLMEAGPDGLPVSEIYRRIRDGDLYRQLDGGPVSREQVYARIAHHPRLFEVDRTVKPMVLRLREKNG